MRDTVIVIPCYNEEHRLRTEVFADFARLRPWLHFLFVNDGSGDGTAAVLEALRRRLADQVEVLHLGTNRGKAEAVRAGMRAAMDRGCRLVGFWDADLATPLAEIEAFRELLACQKVEIVLGARVRLMGRRIERRPLRHYLGRVFATLASMTLGITVYDTQCGAKIFRNSELLAQVLARPFVSKWIFDVEILARCIALSGRRGRDFEEMVVEHPLGSWTDVPGSKLGLLDFPRAVWELGMIKMTGEQ